MLCLTRKIEESIYIGEDIEIRILRIGSRGVQLGITAPRELRVSRSPSRGVVSRESDENGDNAATTLAAPTAPPDGRTGAPIRGAADLKT